MNKNNKGFTMVEILGVFVILGVLAGIAIPSVAKYFNQGKKSSMEFMLHSTYEACEDYMMTESISLNVGSSIKVDVNTLVSNNLLEPLLDPSGGKTCYTKNAPAGSDRSYVTVKKIAEKAGVPAYEYKVHISCPASGNKDKTFPE